MSYASQSILKCTCHVKHEQWLMVFDTVLIENNILLVIFYFRWSTFLLVLLAPLRAGFEPAFPAWEAGALTSMLNTATANVGR